MDLNTSRGTSLLRAYREGQLQVDALVSSANLIGLSPDEVVCLLEDAAESEPGTSRNDRLRSLLIRSHVDGCLTLDKAVAYAIELGLENHEVVRLIHTLGDGTDGMAA
jgi:hypothetical protein